MNNSLFISACQSQYVISLLIKTYNNEESNIEVFRFIVFMVFRIPNLKELMLKSLKMKNDPNLSHRIIIEGIKENYYLCLNNYSLDDNLMKQLSEELIEYQFLRILDINGIFNNYQYFLFLFTCVYR